MVECPLFFSQSLTRVRNNGEGLLSKLLELEIRDTAVQRCSRIFDESMEYIIDGPTPSVQIHSRWLAINKEDVL